MNNDIQNSNPVAHILIVGGNSFFHCDSSDSQFFSSCPVLECPSVPSAIMPSSSFGVISSRVDLADVTTERVIKCKMRSTEPTAGREAALPKIMTGSPGLENHLITMGQCLERIETMMTAIFKKQKVQDWYTTREIATLVDKAEYTVREWCRNGRMLGEKQGSGRGASQAWVISHAEIQRYQKEGLLPLKKP